MNTFYMQLLKLVVFMASTLCLFCAFNLFLIVGGVDSLLFFSIMS